jgi:hypothetical protein
MAAWPGDARRTPLAAKALRVQEKKVRRVVDILLSAFALDYLF